MPTSTNPLAIFSSFLPTHTQDWPPQPSTATGLAAIGVGAVAVLTGQLEVAFPAFIYAVGAILIPDSTTHHVHEKDLQALEKDVKNLELKLSAKPPKPPIEKGVPLPPPRSASRARVRAKK
jgi:hypothetical protein